MLPSWVIRFVLALALAVLPLQGVAETLQAVFCHPQNAAADHSAGTQAHSAHHHGAAEVGHGHPAGHEHASDEPNGKHGSHFCCDLAGAAALLAFAASFVSPRISPVAPAAETPDYSTYLELPQRPPLADPVVRG